MPTTESTRWTLDTDTGWFFDQQFAPEAGDLLADAVSAWLRSDHLRWLVEHVPGRRAPDGPAERLEWPRALGGPHEVADGERLGLTQVVAALGEICDWSIHGTVWDYRVSGERPLDGRDASPVGEASVADVGLRAATLGLCADGELENAPRTLVVLGGRRMAPLNRARAAARAIRAQSLAPVRTILLCGQRPLDRGERESPEVLAYAAGAHTEADLIVAAARRVFAAPIADAELLVAPTPAGAQRASTYDTLRVLAEELAPEDAPVGLVTSPTCRPFQYLEAVRALGLERGLSFELVAHPRAWAAAPGQQWAAAPVYLQEVRSTIQAAARLAAVLNEGGGARPAVAQPAALA